MDTPNELMEQAYLDDLKEGVAESECGMKVDFGWVNLVSDIVWGGN